MSPFRLSLKFFFATLCVLQSRADDDTIWCLIDHITVNECQGVNNQATLTKDDIQVLDKNGSLALYFEAPNDYTVNINNIKVKRKLPNLSGEIGSNIQVPLISAGAISLDYPYQCYPQKKLFEGSQCDNESGVITDQTTRREYCRYCELCDSGIHAENRIDNDKRNIAHPDPDNNVQKKCKQTDAQTYTIKQAVHVPGKKEIEQEINNNKQKVDNSLQKKLEAGKGKFVVYLQVYSSDTPPDASANFYANNRGCECCAKDMQGNTNCKPGIFGNIAFVGGGNPCIKCNNNYVQTCMKGNPEKVACWTIEFNFQITNKSSDVEEFKAQVNYNKNSKAKNYAQAQSGQSSGDITSGALSVGGGRKPESKPESSSSAQPCHACDRAKCINEIAIGATKGYCNNYWSYPNAKSYCCSKCPKVCQKH